MKSVTKRSPAHVFRVQIAWLLHFAWTVSLPWKVSLKFFRRTGAVMKLWNDYEGRILADNYPLQKLLRPEGRSAFFATTNGTGTLSTIRIIEAHYDESEILSRWKAVSAITQPN